MKVETFMILGTVLFWAGFFVGILFDLSSI